MGVEPATALSTELQYVLEHCLGAGGMAETWAARQVRGDGFFHRFCLKFIRPEFRNEPMFQRLFRREAQIGADLRHKNIVSLIEADAEFGFLKFELIDGVNLRELLASLPNGRLSSELVMFIATEVCQALEYVHGKDVLHLDIKAGNILVSTHGEVKLVDFGIAMRIPADGGPATKVRGTPEYMAPEQSEQHRVDGRTDLFSLGVLCYEMLTGRRPADSGSEQHVYEQLARGEYPPIANLIDVQPSVSEIVDTLLQPDPAARFPNAAACLDRLCVTPPSPTLSRELGRLVRAAQVGVVRKRRLTPITSFVEPMIAAARSRKESQTTTQPSAVALSILRGEGRTTAPETQQPKTPVVAQAPLSIAAQRATATFNMDEKPRARATTSTFEIMRRTVEVPRRRSVGALLGFAALIAAALIGSSTALTRDVHPSTKTPTSKSTDRATVVSPVISSSSTTTVAADHEPSPLAVQHDLNEQVAPSAIADQPLHDAAAKKSNPVAKGVLRVGAFPANRVWVNGKCRGPAPFEAQLAPGNYRVGVGDERAIQTRSVKVRAGEVKEEFFNLSSEN
jgi:serine/threonine protein kinase